MTEKLGKKHEDSINKNSFHKIDLVLNTEETIHEDPYAKVDDETEDDSKLKESPENDLDKYTRIENDKGSLISK